MPVVEHPGEGRAVHTPLALPALHVKSISSTAEHHPSPCSPGGSVEAVGVHGGCSGVSGVGPPRHRCPIEDARQGGMPQVAEGCCAALPPPALALAPSPSPSLSLSVLISVSPCLSQTKAA